MTMKHHSCTVVRTMLVEHSTVSMRTGARTEGKSEWQTRSCSTPLFSDAERESGKCRSCASGWTHPNNYPAKHGSFYHAGQRYEVSRGTVVDYF